MEDFVNMGWGSYNSKYNPMERPPKQFEFWPKKMTDEELNEALEEAAKQGRRKGEDLVSKEETTEAIEGESAKPVKISFKENLERVQEIIKKLKEKEKK